MTPIDQTKLHTETQRGNCTAAAFASLLDLPLSEVPEVEEIKEPYSWVKALNEWLGGLGYDWDTWDADIIPPGYSIAWGDTVRGTTHCCIALDGQIVHDPHSSRAGLTRVRGYWTAEPRGKPG